MILKRYLCVKQKDPLWQISRTGSICEHMIECHDISFRYPGADTTLFQGLDLTIDQAGFHALFGPSGVGKTSLARIISGDIEDFSGGVKIAGDRPACIPTTGSGYPDGRPLAGTWKKPLLPAAIP